MSCKGTFSEETLVWRLRDETYARTFETERKGRKVRGRGNARDLFFFFYYFYFLFRIMVFDSY